MVTKSRAANPAKPAARPVRKAAPAAKPAAKDKAPVRLEAAAPLPQGKPAVAKKATKLPKAKAAKSPDKVKKPKLVRDSFTIPKAEYEAIGGLKLRAGKLGHPPKKSELLRAGLKVLATLSDAALLAALAAVPTIKTGRPAA